jgi:hypothetical protein
MEQARTMSDMSSDCNRFATDLPSAAGFGVFSDEANIQAND